MTANSSTQKIDDLQLRAGADVLARWTVAERLNQQPAKILEVRPNSLEVQIDTGEVLLLPRTHSVRWSPTYGVFPLNAVE